jgi:signal transduction histidine kinase
VTRPRLRPTVRLRLAALYALAFFISGAILLGASYVFVRHNLLVDRAPPPNIEGHPAMTDPDAFFDQVRRQVRDAALASLIGRYVIVLALTTLLSAVLGWVMAGRALRPLKQITAAARQVSEENLHERIALSGPEDELKELADTFDSMLARLDAAFASQRSFVANASHELRTPLAIMRTEVDVALQHPHVTKEQLIAMAEVVRSATERSERLIEGLLTLARSDRGDLVKRPIDLAAVAAAEIQEVDAQAAELELRVDAHLGVARALGDPDLLERLIANLVQNAVRYNVAGGWISVDTRTEGDTVVLRVANGGAPITREEAATLATPFRRLGPARTRSDGSGLGLSIVDSVARAHDGRVAIDAPGEGLVVTVELPAAPLQAAEERVLSSY